MPICSSCYGKGYTVSTGELYYCEQCRHNMPRPNCGECDGVGWVLSGDIINDHRSYSVCGTCHNPNMFDQPEDKDCSCEECDGIGWNLTYDDESGWAQWHKCTHCDNKCNNTRPNAIPHPTRPAIAAGFRSRRKSLKRKSLKRKSLKRKSIRKRGKK